MAGFAGQAGKDIAVNVAATTTVDFRMSVSGQTEELTVVAEAPLIDEKETGVGEIVTGTQIENLPLNGRQFGNLAGTRPRRQPRLPHRPHQAHAVRAAGRTAAAGATSTT